MVLINVFAYDCMQEIKKRRRTQINQFYGYWYILRIVGGIHTIDIIYSMSLCGVR